MVKKFPVYDHLSHAALYPPNPEIMKRWSSAILGRDKPDYWGKIAYMKADEKKITLANIAHWISQWLKTLPDDATVSSRQLFEVFIIDHDAGTGKEAERRFAVWSSVMSQCRTQGHLDGWWTKGEKKTMYGIPYVNHHNKRAP